MKKTLIAGAASLAVAAMPVVGVFAADNKTQKDDLAVTITEVCSLAAIHPEGGTGAWATDELSRTMAAGTNEVLGSTEFTIICNHTKGWTVTAAASSNLTSENGDTMPLLKTAINGAGSSGYTVTTSTEDASVITKTGIMTSANQIVAESVTQTPNAGVKFTSTYAAAVAEGQAAGTYEGSVTYTLAEIQ